MKVKAICGLLAVFFTPLIGFCLQYEILIAVNANDLMWFLFWVNLPAVFLFTAIAKLADD